MTNRNTFHVVITLAVLTVATFLQTPAHAQAKKANPPEVRFHVDFRQQQELPPAFAFFGPDPQDVTRFEKEGLRITFPPKRKRPDRVGVESRERIKGDFELTATYEILRTDQPTAGHGVGVELFVATESATKEELAVFRVARVKEGQVYLTSRATTEGGDRQYRLRTFPTDVKSGRLRITRVGNRAALSAADGDSNEFHELNQEDLGPEDVTLVRVDAYPGHAQNELDARIIDLRLRLLRPGDVPALKRNVGNGWLAAGLIVGFAALLLAIAVVAGLFLYVARRKNTSQ